MGTSDMRLRPSISKRGSSSSITTVSPKGSAIASHTKAMSVSSPLNGQHPSKPTTPRTLARKPSPRPQMSPRPPMASGSRPSTPERAVHIPERPIPDYLSPIHRPSVNPSFNVDARTGSDFAPGTNLSGCKMVVEIWAHQSSSPHTPHSAKGKGKERADWHDGSLELEWKVLETWNVNLNELQAFPDNVRIPRRVLLEAVPQLMTGHGRCFSHASEHSMRHFGSPREDILPAHLASCTRGCLALKNTVSIRRIQF